MIIEKIKKMKKQNFIEKYEKIYEFDSKNSKISIEIG